MASQPEFEHRAFSGCDVSHLIFLLLLDLDDTLLDTSGILVPQAHKEAVHAMMAAGLFGEFPSLLKERLELARSVPPDVLSLAQAQNHGHSEGVISKAGFDAYFDRDVGPLKLEDGVELMLRGLIAEGRYLALVTSGVASTQRQKVEALGLDYLHEVHYVPVGGVEVKEGVFREIMTRLNYAPNQTVVIGDRLDSEILGANRIGCHAIWVCRGEHKDRPLRGKGGEYDVKIDHPLGIPRGIEEVEGLRGG